MSGPGHHAFFSARLAVLFVVLCGPTLPSLSAAASDPVAMRIESLVVTPAHGASVVVVVKNLTAQPYAGTVVLEAPDNWTLQPAEQPLKLAAGEVGRFRYLVKHGVNRADNAYPLTVTAANQQGQIVHAQTVFAASAPYFKVEVDGRADEWADALPVTWVRAGKRTTVSTYWNRRQFCLLVAVEEERLSWPGSGSDAFDAVQIALSAEDSVTGNDAQARAGRFEFLLTATKEGGPANCFLLAEPESVLADTQSRRSLADCRYEEAQVWVWREAGTTFYECSLPWSLLREQIPPGEGREFRMSLLVHDPDGTGLRDWGEAAGSWPSERNRLAWSNWAGAAWPAVAPFDNKTAWGLCSSKY